MPNDPPSVETLMDVALEKLSLAGGAACDLDIKNPQLKMKLRIKTLSKPLLESFGNFLKFFIGWGDIKFYIRSNYNFFEGFVKDFTL